MSPVAISVRILVSAKGLPPRGTSLECRVLDEDTSVLDTVSGGASEREGKKDTNEVDIYAFPSATIILVLEVQVMVIAGQFYLRCDPAEAPGGVSPVKSLSELG